MLSMMKMAVVVVVLLVLQLLLVLPSSYTHAFTATTTMTMKDRVVAVSKSSSSRSSSLSTLLYASTLEKPVTEEKTSTSVDVVAGAGAAAATIKDKGSSSSSSSSSSGDIPLAPLTQWGQPYTDIIATQYEAQQQTLPEFSYEIFAQDVVPLVVGLPTNDVSTTTNTNTNTNIITMSREEMELQYFTLNRLHIVDLMQQHGCVIFRNFTLMTTPTGFTKFYQALQMHVCCDPLHTVSARPTIDTDTNNNKKQQSPIYEAVNKESRKNFFIGMHNEFVGTRAPAGAAFVCFTAATTGGEFLIADARRIFRTIPTTLLQQLYNQQIRYSVIELPFFQFIDTNPLIIESFREPIANMIRHLVTLAMNMKVDFDIDLQWITNHESIYKNTNTPNTNTNTNTPSSSTTTTSTTTPSSSQRILQARAPKQPPIVPHPITNDPVWFCNVHSHSAVLRQQRELIYGAERFEDGASQINKSDMYFGNDEPLTIEQLQILDDVTTAQMKYVKMLPGDVVLLDNYKTLHGRNVFDGVRKHGVAWFKGWERS